MDNNIDNLSHSKDFVGLGQSEILASVPHLLMATIWTVNVGGGADFTSIQAAINAASPGDTILVSAGIYDELITINKSLTILGAQANVSPQAGGRPGGESTIRSSVVGSGNRPVQIAANDIVFNGFEITNFFYGIQIADENFLPPDFTIQNIDLEYNWIHSDICFVGFTAQPGILKNLKIANSLFLVSNTGPGNALAAISFSAGTTVNPTYEAIEISNNQIQNLDDAYGIFAGANPSVYVVNGCVISCNHIISTPNGNTFNIGNIADGQFMNNVLEGAGGLIGIQTGVIYGNTFRNGGNLSLWGNEFGFTRPSQNVFISYNDFTDEIFGNGLRIRVGVLSGTIRANLNAFRDSGIPPSTPPDFSTGYLIRNFGIGTLDATNNWWGSAAGPAGNTGGLTGAITTTPWLLSFTLTPSKQTPPSCWPLSTFLLTQPGFWIYPTVNQFLFSVGTHGGIATVGNTLGLWGQFDPPDPAGGIFADGIGAFTTINTGLTYDGYPSGTTDNWPENSSSNVLMLPVGSSVLKAFLFYSATQTTGLQDVSSSVSGAVMFTPPSGIPVSIVPDSVTSIVAPTTGNTFYHAVKDVTALMGGAGSYTLGAVPGALGLSFFTDLENSYAGWTIVVIYENPSLPVRDLTLWDEFDMVFSRSTVDIPIAGFSTSSVGTPSGKLFIAAGNGDNYVAGDQTQFGPTTGSLTVLSGVNNGAGNFYQSQVNDDNGALLLTGTFGSSNQPFGGSAAAPTLPATRQGWDKTAVDVSSTLTLGQTSAVIRLTDPELYVPQYVALQADLATPIIVPTKQVSGITAKIGDILTYTISFTNTGTIAADNIVITDTVPTGTSYLPGSISSNVLITGDPTTSIQLTSPLLPGQTAIVSFRISIDSLPTPNPMLNTATLDYTYVPAVGVPPISATADTNTVSTLVFELARGALFI